MIESYIQLWSKACIQLSDVRRLTLDSGEYSGAYRLPACAFVHIGRGCGSVRMDELDYAAQPFQLLHGGKGAVVELAAREAMEYFLILYKPWLPEVRWLPHRQAEQQQLFNTHYAMLPSSPLIVHDRIRLMHEAWGSAKATGHLQAKALFHQLTADWLTQMNAERIQPIPFSVADQALRYMADNFHREIKVEPLAARFGCSARHLLNQFQNKWQTSPMQALTRIRMDKAAQWLTQTDATLQEIAESVGYVNGFTLNRLFKKEYGLTPGHYRQLCREGSIVRKQTDDHSVSDIVHSLFLSYNDNENQNHSSQRRREKQRTMPLLRRKSAGSMATMLLSAALLLAACSGSPAASSTGSSPANAAQPPAIGENSAAQPAAQTRLFKDVLGEREIPVNPQRIYSFGATNLLVALGITPVGAPRYEVEPDYYLNHLPQKIAIVGDFPPNYEAVLELSPDLIISPDVNLASGERKEYFDGLSRISPVATFAWENDIYDQLRQVAEIVGKQEQAEQWIRAHFARAEAAKQKLSGVIGPNETVAIVWVNGKSFDLMGNRNMGHVIYRLLGLNPPANIAEAIKSAGGNSIGLQRLSLEKIPDIDADRIIVMISKQSAAADNFQAITSSELWKSLPAVQKGHVYEVPYEKWWSYTLLTADGLLEDAVKLFIK